MMDGDGRGQEAAAPVDGTAALEALAECLRHLACGYGLDPRERAACIAIVDAGILDVAPADCHPPYYGQASGPGEQGLGDRREPKGQLAGLLPLPPSQATGRRQEFRCRLKVGGVHAGDARLEDGDARGPLAGVEAVPARQVAQALGERLEHGGTVHWRRLTPSPAVAVLSH